MSELRVSIDSKGIIDKIAQDAYQIFSDTYSSWCCEKCVSFYSSKEYNVQICHNNKIMAMGMRVEPNKDFGCKFFEPYEPSSAQIGKVEA